AWGAWPKPRAEPPTTAAPSPAAATKSLRLGGGVICRNRITAGAPVAAAMPHPRLRRGVVTDPRRGAASLVPVLAPGGGNSPRGGGVGLDQADELAVPVEQGQREAGAVVGHAAQELAVLGAVADGDARQRCGPARSRAAAPST